MKKFLTFILVLAMVMSVSSFAMAANHTVYTVDEFKELLDDDGNGDVADGDTIILGASLQFNSSNGYNGGSYVDGFRYFGDKSFTIDLGGNTISDDGTINDYLLYFNNKGTKENEITLTNGTISGGSDLWAVVTVGSISNTNSTTVNFGSGLTVQGNHEKTVSPYETCVAMSRNGCTINIQNGAKVIAGEKTYYAVNGASIVNIYDGSKIEAKNSNYGIGVLGTGTVNIYGGTITSAGWGVHTSTSGTPKFTISGGNISGTKGAVASAADVSSYPTAAPEVSITGGTINGDVAALNYGTPSGTAGAKMEVSGGTFTEDPSAYLESDAVAASINEGGTDSYAVGKESIQKKVKDMVDSGKNPEDITVTVTNGTVNFNTGDLPGKVKITDNDSTGSVTVNNQPVSSAPVAMPTPVPEKPASTGSGISVKYNGGNSFSTSKSDVPTGVEIDGVPVTFNGTGSSFSVGCISSDAKWVTVRWNSTSVTTNFTPDGLVECTTVSIPKTGDMSFWAAIAQFLGF